MKKFAYLLLLLPLTGGCVPMLMQKNVNQATVLLEPTPPPLVTADRVNEENAAEQARALREEIEHDLAQPAVSPPEGKR